MQTPLTDEALDVAIWQQGPFTSEEAGDWSPYQRMNYLVFMRQEIRRLGLEAMISDKDHFRDFVETQIYMDDPPMMLGASRQLAFQRMAHEALHGKGNEDLKDVS